MKIFQTEVKEWNNRILFMRKVIDGAAERSYGIHVARLAVIPNEVISRTMEVLKELEEEENIFGKISHKRHNSGDDSSQIPLF
jgi:DNA mismatch repair protein MutS